MSGQFAPSLTVARLWEGISAKGVQRLTGRLGGARLAIFPTWPEEGVENPATHTLLLSQADPAVAPGQNYGPALDLCCLEEKVAASGTTYLTGWLGGLRVAVIPDPARSTPDKPAFVLRLTEMKSAQRSVARPPSAPRLRQPECSMRQPYHPDTPRAPALVDDPLPF